MYIQITHLAWLLCTTGAVIIVDRSEGNLSTIPNNIDTNVTILILNKNNIIRIDDNSLTSLVALENLKLNYNRLEFISTKAFINNIHLSELNLRGHRLSTIPPGLGGAWQRLVRVELGDGPLHIPTADVTNFPVLSKLVVDNLYTNSLILRELPSLEILLAKDCKLLEFPDLSDAPNLGKVHLHRNDFTWIPQSALAGLSRLKVLSFPNSRVMYLPDLSHLVSLEMFIVHGNALIAIPDMYDLPITKINLVNNPLVCDRAMCWIRLWDYMKHPLDGELAEKGICAAPTHLMGLLMDVRPVELMCYEG